MAKVSIVIPTHNRPHRLANALHSVLGQTEKDVEIFVIDDGSNDNAAADVVRACSDPRIIYIRLPTSRGPGAARNAGIMRANAPYVAFLDDDDEWLPKKLETQLQVLEQSGASVGGIYTARFTFDEVTGTTETTRLRGPKFDPASAENAITTSSLLIRRHCFDVAGLFDEDILVGEDFDLWLRVAQTFELHYLDQPLLRYRIHEGGASYDCRVPTPSLERLLVKHPHIFESSRGAPLYVLLSTQYYGAGELGKALKTFWHAVRLAPLAPKIYWAFARAVARGLTGAAARTPAHPVQ